MRTRTKIAITIAMTAGLAYFYLLFRLLAFSFNLAIAE